MNRQTSARRIGGILPHVLCAAVLTAQTASAPPEEHTIRISVNLVELDAVVTDRQGNAVKDLTAADFEILQDGKPQRIRSAQWIPWGGAAGSATAGSSAPKSNPAPAPLTSARNLQRRDVRRTVAIVVDDLGLSFESVARLRDALKAYIRDRMQPDDLVAILTTGRSLGTMSQFTSDKRLLLAAVDHLRWNSWGRAGVSAMQTIALTPEERARRMSPQIGPPPNPETDPEVMRQRMFLNGTMAAVRNVVEGLRDYPGRKSLLLISESMPLTLRSQNGDPTADNTVAFGNNSIDGLRQLSDAAGRNFVVIDTIDPRGLMVGSLTAADDTSDMSSQEVQQRVQNRNSDVFESQNGLSYLAGETGGTFQFNDNDLGRMVTRAVDGVGGYYLIAYTPDDGTFLPKEADKWHRIKVRVKRPDLRVRARSGFIGRPDEARQSTSGPRAPATLMEAMLSPFAGSGIGVRLTGYHVEDPKAGTLVSALLHVDAKDIAFEKDASGEMKASVEVIGVSLNPQGKVETQSAKVYDLSVKPDRLAHLQRQGFVYTLYHPVKKPGGFQLRIGVRDRRTGRIGTASQYMEVPDVKKGRLLLSSMLVQAQSRTVLTSPAVRQFEPQSQLLWGARILNAKRGKDDQPKLTREVVVYRDGKKLFQTAATPWNEEYVDDPKRLPVTGGLQLGPRMAPGEYVLQLIIRDLLQTDEKKAVASQAIDFEVRAAQ